MSLAPTSPRLPSPPPAAEIQIGPKSPAGGPAAIPQTAHQEQTMLDASSRRRIHPGTKSEDMAAGPPLIPLQELDSAFQLQEHLAALHCYHTASGTKAISRATALKLAQPPAGIDRTLWLYELCRFLISQCNSLIVGFLFDTPPCSANTCPEMRASEWQFLCSVHEQPKSCCAIDYCCHTLDWAANVVTDHKIFPSRFVVQAENHSKNIGLKNLVNIFRRLHRIFAHAWFQHRGVFWSVESETGLYVFFKTVCDLYDLLPAENYKLPPEAEGLDVPPPEPEVEKPPPQILKPPSQQRGPPPPSEDDSLHPMRTNTRRHVRSSPSTGSAVTTVMEAEEEEGDAIARRMREMHIAPPTPIEDEAEISEVPMVIKQTPLPQSKSEPKTKPSSEPPVKEKQDEEAAEVSDVDQTITGLELEKEHQKDKESAAEVPPAVAETTSDAAEPTKESPKASDEPATQKKDEPPSESPSSTEKENPELKEKPATDSASTNAETKKPEEKGPAVETPSKPDSGKEESDEKAPKAG